MQNAGHIDVYVIPAHVEVRNIGMSVVSCKPGVEPRNPHRAGVSVCQPQMGRYNVFTARDVRTGQSAAVFAALHVGLNKTEIRPRLGATRKLRDSCLRQDLTNVIAGC